MNCVKTGENLAAWESCKLTVKTKFPVTLALLTSQQSTSIQEASQMCCLGKRCTQFVSCSINTIQNHLPRLYLSVIEPNRITESTSSCGSAGMTPGWSCHRTSSLILSLLIPRCSNVSGNLTCSLQTKRAQTFTMLPRRTFSFSSSVMEMSSSVWGNHF